MKPRGLLMATAALVVLAGGVYWSNRDKKAEDAKPPADTSTKILDILEPQISQIEFKRKDGSDTVVKRDPANNWRLISPKQLAADNDVLTSITGTLGSLNAERVVEEKAADLSQYGLSAPTVEVDITKKDGKVQKLFIGDETPTMGSAFAAVAGDPRVFTITNTLKTNLNKGWQDLRDKRLLTFDQDKLSRVELSAKKSVVDFGRNAQNEWTIVQPKPMRADGWQVEELIHKLKDAKMGGTAAPEAPQESAASFAGGTPVAIVKLTDASGTQSIEVRKAKDDYYAKSSVVDGVFKVPADLGKSLDKSVDDFRNKKLFDFGFTEPSKIAIVNGSAAPVVYQKTGDKWFNGPKPIDSTSLQNFVDKARDLSATKFVEAAFGASLFEVTVTSNEGKRTEKVLLAKTGNDYFAKRDNEPSIYQLDGKVADDLMKSAADIKAALPEKKK